MKDLVNSLVDKCIDHQGHQQTKEELLKIALQEARNKSLGGARTTNTPPASKDMTEHQKEPWNESPLETTIHHPSKQKNKYPETRQRL
jgi:hypothetical protein